MANANQVPRRDLEWRKQWQQWAKQWEHKNGDSPNYVRSLAKLLAGLMQAQPIAFAAAETAGADGAAGAAQPLDVSDFAELTDDAVPQAAARSVVYIKPVEVAGEWVASVLEPSEVDARWTHKRLQEAVVFTGLEADNGDTFLVTELYDADEDGPLVELWAVTLTPDRAAWSLDTLLDIEAVDDDHPAAAWRDFKPRRLIPFVWSWEHGRPAPVHAGQEHLVDKLNALHKTEDGDAVRSRNIVVMDERSMIREDVLNPSNDRVLGRAGVDLSTGTLLVNGSKLTEHGAKGFVDMLRFDDDLIGEDRIERRVDSWLEACGISPSTLGRGVSGRSDSGAAKRADSQLTVTTIGGPARRWEGALNAVAAELARLSEMTAPPSVQVSEGLKIHQEDLAALAGELRSAEAASTEQIVRTVNPGMQGQDLADEVARVRAEYQLGTPPDEELDD